jgi:hypothetical protein
VGWGVLEDQRLRALPGLDLAERPRVGQPPARQGGGRLPGARQRLWGLRRPGRLAAQLRSAGNRGGQAFFWRWQQRLPSPFTRADLKAGYRYELAVRQFEVSDTRVFDRPAAGRAFFEGLIRDHLDLGRPSQVALIFDRTITRGTPAAFRTKVITKGVDPQLVCYDKSSRIKQYFKQHRALRTQTVVGDTRDFGSGGGSAPATGGPFGPLASTPTSVCATRKPQTPAPLPTWSPWPG